MEQFILFDMVDTLVRRKEKHFCNVVTEILNRRGGPISSEEFFKAYRSEYAKYSIGLFKNDLSYYESILESLSFKDSVITKNLVSRLSQAYFSSLSLYDDTIPVLENLCKRYALALVTNYVKEWTDKILSDLKIKKYFRAIIISSEIGCMKPNEKIFKQTMEILGNTYPSVFTVVGNKYEIDISTPLRMGMRAFLIDRYECNKKSAGAVKVKSLFELLEYL